MNFEKPAFEESNGANTTEQPQLSENALEKPIDEALVRASEQFLGDEIEMLSRETIQETLAKAAAFKENLANTIGDEPGDTKKRKVFYDKYKKSLFYNGQKVSIGTVIASRHAGLDIVLPKELDQSGEGKKLRRQYVERLSNDYLWDELNYELATHLAKTERREDTYKSEAYKEIAKNKMREKTPLGLLAEKVTIGFAETIAIDRQDFGLSVIPGNAFQDVENKIDFILETVHKKRGVGIEHETVDEEHKAIGIQFTINTSKEEFKKEQIAKAKERGVFVNDILYVAIEEGVLAKALHDWENARRPITGPWNFLPKEVQRKLASELFDSVLTEEQKAAVLKQIG